ncbi:MAG: MarR family transcriptional regulator [Pseudomonadota bacterium]
MTAVGNTRQALQLWRDVLAHMIRDDRPDLTARQLAIVLTVYLGTPPHTVRGLSTGLSMPKPAVTRALDALVRQGLVKRARDEKDKRNVLVQRTVKGSIFLSDFGETVLSKQSGLYQEETP